MATVGEKEKKISDSDLAAARSLMTSMEVIPYYFPLTGKVLDELKVTMTKSRAIDFIDVGFKQCCITKDPDVGRACLLSSAKAISEFSDPKVTTQEAYDAIAKVIKSLRKEAETIEL